MASPLDHPYEPSGEWWTLCKVCGLAQAAHNSSTPEAYAAQEAHFATLKRATPLEVMAREKERIKLGEGRVKIGYIGDDYDDDEE
jgi:hypothetical protein